MKKLSLPLLPRSRKKLPVIVVTGSILLLGISATIWAANRQTEHLLTNEPQVIQSYRSDLLALQAALLDITSPAKFYIGQGYVTSFTEKLQQQIDNMPQAAPTQPPQHLPSFIPRSSPYWAKARQVNSLFGDHDTQEAYEAAYYLPHSVRQLFVHHLDITQTLSPVLDYNPETDFMAFDINNPDTIERLKRAKDGIAKANSDIQAASGNYPDSSLHEIFLQLDDMQAALKTLESTGDTAAWKTTVEAAQQAILDNRANFWEQESARLTQEMQAVNQVFSSLESSLRLLAAS